MKLSVKDIAVSLCNGTVRDRFDRSEADANELIRKAIMKTAGCEDGWDKHLFQHNQHLVFKLLEEILEETVGQQIMERSDSWVDFRSVSLGDTIEFKVPNQELFNVGIVCDGTDNLRRQRIMHNKIVMTSFQLGTKVYEEYMMFVMG